MLHEAQNVEITGSGFQLRPIATFIKTPITMKELSELFDGFNVYQFYLEEELLYERTQKLQEFVNEISGYLMDLSNDNLSFGEYIELRKSDFPEEIEKIKKMYKDAAENIADPKHPSIQDLKRIALRIERKIVKSIIGEYAPLPQPRRVIIRRSKISKPN